MLSPTIKKRNHSEETAVEDVIKKKTKILDSPTSLPYDSDSSPSPQPSNEYSPVAEKPLTLTQQKRNKRRTLYESTMALVKNDTTIQVLQHVPYPTLASHASWTPYLKLTEFSQLAHYEQQGWRLCTILFEPCRTLTNKSTTTSSSALAHQQAMDFKQWLIQTVSTHADTAIQTCKKTEPKDPYAPIFTAMTFGRIQEATTMAMQQDDYTLALFLSSPLSPNNALKQRVNIESKNTKDGKKKKMSVYQAKIWQALCGETDLTLIHGLDWKQALVLYILYGKTRSGEDPLDTLIGRYIKDTKYIKNDDNNKNEKELTLSITSRKERDASPWYNAIQWWWQRTYNNQKLDTVHITAWPSRLAWRFVISFRDELSTTMITDIMRRWCTDLQAIGLSEWALFSSLFTSSKEMVVSILSRSPFIANEYNIPVSWIKEAEEAWQKSLTFKKDTPSIAQSL